MLSAYFSFSQNQKDTIVFDRKLEEVTISATKTAKSIAKLPIPVMIISEKEIKEFGSSKLFDVIKRQTGIVSVTAKTGTEGLQMQGLDASYTTILLDGFPIIGRSFGALDLNRIALVDVEKIAPVVEGDTIVTSGRSSIFPIGIKIGTVSSFELDAAENYYEINVKLFNDMTNIEHVYVIKNNDKEEITNLLNGTNE